MLVVFLCLLTVWADSRRDFLKIYLKDKEQNGRCIFVDFIRVMAKILKAAQKFLRKLFENPCRDLNSSM